MSVLILTKINYLMVNQFCDLARPFSYLRSVLSSLAALVALFPP